MLSALKKDYYAYGASCHSDTVLYCIHNVHYSFMSAGVQFAI